MNKKILGIGNAIVDVFAQVEENFLKENNLIKGSMKLINEEEFVKLKQKIKIEKTLAGGSVANSMAGISYLNGDASFIGKINSDEFGELYKKSLEDIDVKFIYNPKKELMPTGTCIILITPDSERTMCTYLGISSQLAANDLSEKNIIDKELIFLEGYLWDKGLSEKMFKQAINFAKKNKVKIAMTLSDIFCVTRHKVDFYNLLKNDLDVLIGNENEINELTGNKNLSNSINQLILLNKLIIVTRSEKGSLAIDNNIIIDCDSIQVNKVIDVTGAGDLFAAGFLKEYIEKSEIKKCLTTGSLMASKIIQKIGARIE
jgi:sugar/nucleoside kinase (ribokinase family)